MTRGRFAILRRQQRGKTVPLHEVVEYCGIRFLKARWNVHGEKSFILSDVGVLWTTLSSSKPLRGGGSVRTREVKALFVRPR